MATVAARPAMTASKLTASLVWLLVLASGAPAHATCDCGQGSTLAEQIEGAQVIFRGELRSLSEDWEGCSGTGTWNYAMLVLEVYKGSLAERINVRSPPPGDGSCGIPVQREGEFLIYANALEEYREYESTLCMGTKALADAQEDLAALGTGGPPDSESSCAALGPVSVPGLLVMAALGLWITSNRRRSRVPPLLRN